jgi:hypothetical protein
VQGEDNLVAISSVQSSGEDRHGGGGNGGGHGGGSGGGSGGNSDD